MVKWCKCKSRILFPIALLLLVATFAVCLATSASAAEVTASGTCGDALTWQLTDDGVLTISGTGAMTDFTNPRSSTSSTPPPWYAYQSSITIVVVNEGVTSIGSYAFDSCKSISRVSLPESLTAIGTYAFYACTALYSVDIPDSVNSLGSYVFEGCTSLSSVVLPDNLTAIPDRCFYNCSSLVSVDLPSSINSIGAYSFNGTSIADITIPVGVTSVGYSAFYSKSLVSVHFLGTTPPSVSDSFATTRECPLDYIYVPVGCVDAYASASGWSKYAKYLAAEGYAGTFGFVNISDYLTSFDNGETELNRIFTISDYIPPVSTTSYSISYIDNYVADAYGGYSLRHYNEVFYIGDLTQGAYDWSLTASYTYTSSNSSPYSGSKNRLYVYFYDANGQYISSFVVSSTSSIKPSSGTKTYSLSLLGKDFPSDAMYMAVLYSTPTFSGMNVSSFVADMEFSVRSEPVIPADTPAVSDDFGGEVTYLRGQAATPLSVTATVTDGGTLSYQWYYIDSENVDVAVPIDGATGSSYTPDTRSVGSRYYYCIVTNTLGELTASMYSDYAYVTVTRPDLGDGYDIYDYKDYVAGSVVEGSNKTYTITFPMSGIYTELYGGFNGAYSLLDYFTGTDIYCDLPTSAQGDDTFNARLDFYPLGMGSQYNVLKLRNIAQGIPAAFVFAVDFDADMYCAAPVLTFYWYDEDLNLIGSTDQELYQDIDLNGCTWYSADWDFTYPGSAVCCAYCVSVPDFQPEENVDFSLQIIIADLVLTFSMMEDISGSIGEVGDKIDGVGDKIDQVGGEIIDGIGETNDKLDDLINGSDASQDIVDRVDQEVGDTTSRGEELLDQLDSIPHPPAQDVIVSVDSWYQNDTEDSFNNIVQIIWENDIVLDMLMLTCTLMLVSYVLFGKRG